MKLLLVDDHDLFATSLKVVLERFEDIEEVAILKTPDSLWPFGNRSVFPGYVGYPSWQRQWSGHWTTG